MASSDIIHISRAAYWGQNVPAFQVSLSPGYWEVIRSEGNPDSVIIMVRRVSEEDYRAAAE